MTKSYDQLVQEQIEQYRNVPDLNALPASFKHWSYTYLRPGMEAVFGFSGITEFYVNAFLEAAAKARAKPAFLSLGCGDGAIEIPIAIALVQRGLTEFRFVCYDLSEPLLDKFRGAIPDNLRGHFELSARDLNGAAINEHFDAVMANHSLHHMVDLEGIFRALHANLSDDGIFVTNDMIGRNGHMRWPETKLFVDFLWPFLTLKQRFNPLLSRLEAEYINHDCATVGFEGVRAQDILPAILAEGFQPAKFLAAGGVVDIFVERCFGPNFDLDHPDDAFLIDRAALLSEIMLDAGLTTPTLMLAYFTKQSVAPIFYRNRTAQSAIRTSDPIWLVSAIADLEALPRNPEFVFRQPFVLRPDLTLVVAEQQSRIAELLAIHSEQTARIAALERSRSSKLTAPLRALKKAIGKRQARLGPK